jgi:anti-sigma B factor antagonist
MYCRRLVGHLVVELHGELDFSGAGALRPYLDTVTRRIHDPVIADLRPVAFLDCAGLSLLVRASRRVREHGGRLLVVCTRPLHLRTMHLTGLDQMIPHFPTLDDALSECARGNARG